MKKLKYLVGNDVVTLHEKIKKLAKAIDIGYRSSLFLREFTPQDRGYVAPFGDRSIGADPAVHKQPGSCVEF